MLGQTQWARMISWSQRLFYHNRSGKCPLNRTQGVLPEEINSCKGLKSCCWTASNPVDAITHSSDHVTLRIRVTD